MAERRRSQMRFGLVPEIPVQGKDLTLWVEGGQPGGRVTVDMFDSEYASAAKTQIEVQLDERGAGVQRLDVPARDSLHFVLDGVRLSRGVKRQLTLGMRLARFLANMSLKLEFVAGGAGSAHGLGWIARARLLRRIRVLHRALQPLSTFRQHLRLAEDVLRIPPEVEGDVVECGCYGGGSTATLSLACAATGRRLFVCDSFEGLPPPTGEEWRVLTDGSAVSWSAGQLASPGSLEGVQQAVRDYGEFSACQFVKGFFSDTLPDLQTDAVAMVFEDADLMTSVRDCLLHLWPKLQVGCKFYSHEPWDVGIVSKFYDDTWWKEHVGGAAPGFIGSGGGGIDQTKFQVPGLGYAVKGVG